MLLRTVARPRMRARRSEAKRTSAVGVVIFAALAVLLTAKGPTTKITIKDTKSGKSIEIADPRVLKEFNVRATSTMHLLIKAMFIYPEGAMIGIRSMYGPY